MRDYSRIDRVRPSPIRPKSGSGTSITARISTMTMRRARWLRRRTVRLLAQGSPLNIGDAYRGVGWRIHPFLFEVLEGEPRLNWEHDDIAWVRPSELASYHTLGWLPQVFYNLEALSRR